MLKIDTSEVFWKLRDTVCLHIAMNLESTAYLKYLWEMVDSYIMGIKLYHQQIDFILLGSMHCCYKVLNKEIEPHQAHSLEELQ